MKLIKNVSLILPHKIINNGAILFSDRIEKIYTIPPNEIEDVEMIDGKNCYLSPGFIDIHIHGAGGSDIMEGTRESLENISKTIFKYGVTSFLPTTMTMADLDIKKALDNIKKMKKEGLKGAQPLGVHLEGPFINKNYKGAQPGKNIQNPNLDLIEEYFDLIKIITLAPEIEGAQKFIKKLVQKGITIAVAHSSADYKTIKKAEVFGLDHAAHLFNAMTGLHHRKPGIVGAVLNGNMTAELIADYVHVDPAVLELVTKIKDLDKVILVTDSMEAGGLADGEYSLGGQKVFVKDDEARLEDGTIAGSVLTLDQAVRNMLNATKLNINEVINMATLNPAKRIGLDHEIGQLKEGLKSDLILLSKDLEVKKVFLSGKEVRGDFYC